MNYASVRLISLLLVCCAAGAVQANLIGSIESTTLVPGATGTIDVQIRSDGTEHLQAYGIRLQLESPQGHVRFVSPLTASELTDATYIFFGDSDAAINGSTATVGTAATTDDTYDGADFTASLGDVDLTTERRLLVRLDVTALSDATPGTFELRFVDASSTFFDAAANSIPFTSTSGTVTVVPEPNTSFIVVVGGCFVVLRARRGRQSITLQPTMTFATDRFAIE